MGSGKKKPLVHVKGGENVREAVIDRLRNCRHRLLWRIFRHVLDMYNTTRSAPDANRADIQSPR